MLRGRISIMSEFKIPGHAWKEWVYHLCVFCQIDLRDDPKTLARLLYMKEKPLTYEHGVKLAKAVRSDVNLILNVRWEEFGVCLGMRELRRLLVLKCIVFGIFSLPHILPSVVIRPGGTIWFAFLSAGIICFSLRKKLGESQTAEALSIWFSNL